jgi:hypothetical protein
MINILISVLGIALFKGMFVRLFVSRPEIMDEQHAITRPDPPTNIKLELQDQT